MLLELAKPVSLLLTILFLCAVFHTAFLVPASSLPERILASVEMLVLAAGSACVSGLIFRDWAEEAGAPPTPLTRTFPLQTFYWATGTMVGLFLLSWFFENYCEPLRAFLAR